MPPQLRLIILAVRDLGAMARFYRDALGWPQLVDAPVYVELQLGDGPRLGLYARDGYARNLGAPIAPAPSGGLTHVELYLTCVDGDALDAAIARACAAGARLISPRAPRPWGDEVAYLADPEDNVLALARPS